MTRRTLREVFYSVKPDDELIRDVRHGDGAAFERLAERYYPLCLRFAERHLGQRADAEEVVQDAMMRAYRTLRRGGAPERFRPWLLAIVLNRCRSLLAGRRRRERLFGLWSLRQRPQLDGVVPGADGPEEISPALRGALASLSPLLREAFLLRHVEELDYEEMARVTGAGVSALKMRVKRASELLVQRLSEEP